MRKYSSIVYRLEDIRVEAWDRFGDDSFFAKLIQKVLVNLMEYFDVKGRNIELDELFESWENE